MVPIKNREAGLVKNKIAIGMVTSDINIKYKPFVFVVFVRTNVQEKLEDTNKG
jgi:hypothetical protein